MKKLVLTLFVLALAAPLSAQRLNLDFPGLGDKASEVVDVTLDGIYVRSYEFDKEWEYDRGIVERLHAQLGPSWKKIVNVRGRRENSEIYIDTRNDQPVGLLIISAEPRELTVVNIVGPIDVEKLSLLEGNFGVPYISKSKNKDKHHD